MKREECECDLQFAGFVVIACPLKNDSKAAIKQIQESSHHVRIASQRVALDIVLTIWPYCGMKKCRE